MPTIMTQVALAGGATNPNIYQGSAFEFARRRGIVSMGVTIALADAVFAGFNAGADVIAEEFIPPALDRYPIIPDEMYFSDVVEAGDRLKVFCRNVTAATTVNVRSALQIQDA